MSELEQINISDAEIDEYVNDLTETWDIDTLVSFARDTLFEECKKMDSKMLVATIADHFGEEWMREFKLKSFK